MKKILIVDNSSYMRMFVRKIIEKGGFNNIVEASDKDEAIEVFKNENPEIVILDLNMSEFKMDGIYVLTEIMNINAETVVIIASAVGHEDVKVECLSLGAKAYIRKPFGDKILLNTLEEYK